MVAPNPQREARLAAALRENLKKRKAQARARDESDPLPEPGEQNAGEQPRNCSA